MADLPDPNAVVTALTRNGWTVAGGRKGENVRLTGPPGFRPNSLVITLDESAPEHADMMRAALTEIERAADAGRRAAAALDAIYPTGSGVPAQVVKEATDLVYDLHTGQDGKPPLLAFLMHSGSKAGAPRSAAAVVDTVAPLIYNAGRRSVVGS